MDQASLFIGANSSALDKKSGLLLRMANRHGLVAGATGTGKTVTLQILAEGFSKAGVPVFLTDVKGDLSGLCLQRGRFLAQASRGCWGHSLRSGSLSNDLLGFVCSKWPSGSDNGFRDGASFAQPFAGFERYPARCS